VNERPEIWPPKFLLPILDSLHHACTYLADQVRYDSPREVFQANIDARILLIRAAQQLLKKWEFTRRKYATQEKDSSDRLE